MNFQNIDNISLVFYSITIIMTLIWLIGVVFALSRFKTSGLMSGTALINCNYDEISQKIASVLSQDYNFMLSVQIIEQTTNKLSFITRRAFNNTYIEMYFTQSGSNVEVTYAMDIRKVLEKLKLVAYLICFLYCLLFIVGVPILIWFLALYNPDTEIRLQTFQIFQMVHGAWPPYLIGGITSFKIKYYQNFINYLLQVSSFKK